MNDDDLTHRLEAWAAATDPGPDPITAAEVGEADGRAVGPLRAPRHRRWLAVAAAVVTVAGVAAAVAVTGDDGAPPVITRGVEDAAEPRTQVVVVADLDDGDAPRTHRFTIEARCADRAACIPTEPRAAGPLRAGASLVAHVPLAGGEWTFRYEADTCGDPCGPLDESGAWAVGGDHPLSCSVDLPPADDPRRIVVRVTDLADGLPACALDTGGTVPDLDVPPAWSVRDPLPWDCGTGAWDAARPSGPLDPAASAEALDCFGDAVDAGTPMELPTSTDTVGPTDEPRESWWRIGTEGPGGRGIEVLSEQGGRGRPWSRTWCRTVDGATLADCTEAEPLPLELPPLDGAGPATPATTVPATATLPLPDTTPAGPGHVDLVVDAAELPMWIEGVERRWVLSVAGGEVLAEGLVEEPGSPQGATGGTGDVSLVARGVPAPAGKALLLTLEEYDCYAGGCSPPRGYPGSGAGAEVEDLDPTTTCPSEVPPVDQDRVILLTLRGESCSATLVGSVPDLTVPAAWTLRTPADRVCADYPEEPEDFDLADMQRVRAACVLDALDAGATVVEMPQFGEDGDDTLRVEGGVVTLFSRTGVDDGRAWSIEVCTDVVEADDAPFLEPRGCRDQPTGL